MVERSVWYRLPDELTERVLAFLPVRSVFHCRCVCKQWNSLLKSDSFLGLWAEISPPNLWFLVYHTNFSVAAFSPGAHRWNNVPLYERCSLDPTQVFLLASAGGLLCFRSRNFDSLIVCNPVTCSRRVLPSMSQIRFIDIVGMVADKVSNFYQILVTGTDEPTSTESITELYDSRTGRWTYHCRSRLEFLQVWYVIHAIWHDGFFYCLATPLNTSKGHRLIAYDLENRNWMDLNVKMPSADLRCLSLVICGERLLLTGKLVEGYTIKGICIWELLWNSLEWVKIGIMPDYILRDIHSPNSILVQCQGHGTLLCFSTHRGWQSVMYHLSDRSWKWVPENKDFGGSPGQAIGRNNLVGLPYEPSLSASV